MKKLDAFQRRYRVTAFAYGVQKKYGDDRGGYLAALITYYGFLSTFPLLLASFTVVAYVLAGHQSEIDTLQRHLSAYPIIGPAASELQGATLKGSPFAIVVGVLLLVWGAMGLAQVAEFTMQEAWNVTGWKRPGFVPRLVRGLGWYVTIGLGIVLSTSVTSLGSILKWSGGPALSALMALILNVIVFSTSFWILSPRSVPFRQLLPGAVFAGGCWTFFTGLGVGLAHELAHSNQLYGTFASVLALLAFLYLTARLTIYGIEANVVKAQHLWPRSLTDKDLEPADRDQLLNLAKREERVQGFEVSGEFHPPNSSADMARAASQEAGSPGEPTNTANRPGPPGHDNRGASSEMRSTTASP